MTLKEIEAQTKRNILDRIKEAVEAKDYTTTKDGTDDAIIVDGITILLWKTAYYVRILSSITISVNSCYDDVTDEDRSIHAFLTGSNDAKRIEQNIHAKEKELAELRDQLAKATATA